LLREETIIEAQEALYHRIQALQHDLAGLLVLLRERAEPALGWTGMPDAYALHARAFVDLGAPLLALEVAAEGLEAEPAHVALRQVQGLALARSGNTSAANGVLEGLREQGHLEDETLGMLARTHKDLGLAAHGEPRRNHLEAALRLYGQVYELNRGHWAGINLATLAALQGDTARAAAVARDVTRQCMDALERLEDADPERYWLLATLGEAALSLQDWAAAERWYREAATCGRHRFGDLNSTRRHARLLLARLGGDARLVDQWLPLPRVVLFSGHLTSRPDWPGSCFPPGMERALYASIRGWLESHNGLIGVSAAACAADLLFLEALESLGGETHVVLPYHAEYFVEDSVDRPGVEGWRPRLERQLGHARVVYASSSRPLHGGVAGDYANQVAHGLGLLRARELDTEVMALATWDGRGSDGQGGTAGVVRQWQRHGLAVDCVQLDAGRGEGDGLLEVRRLPALPGPAADQPARPTADRVMSLLFADAVEFSRLDDAEVPLFVESCLGMVARLVSEAGDSIPVRETWGDGLFLAFDSVQTAGLFALRLLDTVEETDWRALGFSRPLAMRLALHAGPVHLTTDPITGLAKCCGTHVSRAARLEPKTPPGQVYASEAFAALAAMEGARGFRCDYVKQLEWAKRYGTFPAYVLRRDDARGGG
jgi:class 3 adenylate cyclase/tetratricopeptide (TPR) repeat protein